MEHGVDLLFRAAAICLDSRANHPSHARSGMDHAGNRQSARACKHHRNQLGATNSGRRNRHDLRSLRSPEPGPRGQRTWAGNCPLDRRRARRLHCRSCPQPGHAVRHHHPDSHRQLSLVLARPAPAGSLRIAAKSASTATSGLSAEPVLDLPRDLFRLIVMQHWSTSGSATACSISLPRTARRAAS